MDSLSLYSTFYTDLYSVEDYLNLKSHLKTLPKIEIMYEEYYNQQKYNLSWHDEF